MLKRFIILLTAISFIVLGCKKDPEQEESLRTDVSKPKIKISENVTPEELCEKLAKLGCYNIFKCCTNDVIEDIFGIGFELDENNCLANLILICEENLSFILWALEQNSISLDSVLSNECIDELMVDPEEGCFPYKQVTSSDDSSCKDIITGNRAAGEDCLDDKECAKDTYCDTNRKCKANPGKGEECSINGYTDDCKDGHYCAYDEEDSKYKCVALGKKDEECNTYTKPCAKDLYCKTTETDTVGSGDGTCKDKIAIDKKCSTDDPCKDGLCLPGNCDDGRTCYKDEDCTGKCEVSEYPETCDEDIDCGGVCEGTESTSCSDVNPCAKQCSHDSSTCDDDIDCNGATCEISGSACSSKFYCSDDSHCSVTTDTLCYEMDSYCLVGETCEPDEECIGGGTCETSGDPCYTQFGCGDSHCSVTTDLCYGNSGYCLTGETCVPDEKCVPAGSNTCDSVNCVPSDKCIGKSDCNDRNCAHSYGTEDGCDKAKSVFYYWGGESLGHEE